ncbi:MAG: HupE/UreJ family protein [Gammaproteobacteria bacterium]|nr:HupE/UreJ family protein [Gammaproteobacteria bacterium]MDJ0873183.1 HupE/UreJ family protein [Gammaproteobacteria bacterium]MDJ0890679.1 HupE/UreJ family protein [Gammaproteobacteria bacterium]
MSSPARPMHRWVLATALLLLPLAGWAHKPSDSYLRLRVEHHGLEGRWDIALRDLEYALGLDADHDGLITWGELRVRHADIAAYALARLRIATAEQACAIRATQYQVANHSDGTYMVLGFNADCPKADVPLTVTYGLFFDLDPTHRGLLRIESGDSVETAILSPGRPSTLVEPQRRGWWQAFVGYWREGVWHIWIGFDHTLFLLALLFPAVLMREGGQWRQAPDFRSVFWEVVAVVTAFTVAHSITLSVAVLGWVSLPARLVESVIAATVLVAALNNLYPLVYRRRALIAFLLGLVHGLGFATVLADLELPGGTLAVALAGFNLGVETGQLAIVAVFLPVAFRLRAGWVYRRIALGLGSAVVAVIAGTWLIERSLDTRFMPL